MVCKYSYSLQEATCKRARIIVIPPYNNSVCTWAVSFTSQYMLAGLDGVSVSHLLHGSSFTELYLTVKFQCIIMLSTLL